VELYADGRLWVAVVRLDTGRVASLRASGP